jgi:hypothetical protein
MCFGKEFIEELKNVKWYLGQNHCRFVIRFTSIFIGIKSKLREAASRWKEVDRWCNLIISNVSV